MVNYKKILVISLLEIYCDFSSFEAKYIVDNYLDFALEIFYSVSHIGEIASFLRSVVPKEND